MYESILLSLSLAWISDILLLAIIKQLRTFPSLFPQYAEDTRETIHTQTRKRAENHEKSEEKVCWYNNASEKSAHTFYSVQ